MQRKTGKPLKSQSQLEIEKKYMSFAPVNRNGWWIKFSTNRENHHILLLFTSMFTGQTIIRFFENEDEAVQFINFIIENNPTEQLTFE